MIFEWMSDPAASTLAGYILWQLGHLPTDGDRIAAGDLEFEVVAMAGRTIDKVRIRRPQPVSV